MDNFKINLSRTRIAANDLTQMKALFEQYEETLNDCASRISLSLHYEGINSSLRTVSGKIAANKEQLAELSSVLENIAQLYESTENKILGQGRTTETPDPNITPETAYQAAPESSPETEAEEEMVGSIERALELLESVIGDAGMSFVFYFLESVYDCLAGAKLCDKMTILSGILEILNYMVDDLQNGATINSLLANMIISAADTMIVLGVGAAAAAAVTGLITFIAGAGTGGPGAAAFLPYAPVVGKFAGSFAGSITDQKLDHYNAADNDGDGLSNREEIKRELEFCLDQINPAGNDQTYYLPEAI